jgi:hypothetical protein
MSRPKLRLLKFQGAKVDEMRARQTGRRLQRLIDDDRALVEDLVEALLVLRAGAGQRQPAAARELARDLACSTAVALADAAATGTREAC